MHSLKNVVIFIQTILSFVLWRTITKYNIFKKTVGLGLCFSWSFLSVSILVLTNQTDMNTVFVCNKLPILLSVFFLCQFIDETNGHLEFVSSNWKGPRWEYDGTN